MTSNRYLLFGLLLFSLSSFASCRIGGNSLRDTSSLETIEANDDQKATDIELPEDVTAFVPNTVDNPIDQNSLAVSSSPSPSASVSASDSIETTVDMPPLFTGQSFTLSNSTYGMGRICPTVVAPHTVQLSATDPENEVITYTIKSQPTNGEATISGSNLIYTPNEEASGNDPVTVSASDGQSSTDAVFEFQIRALESNSFTYLATAVQAATGHFTETYGANGATVVFDWIHNQYVMYFNSRMANPMHANCGGGSFQVGRAVSSDMVHWTVDTDPVLSPVIAANSPYGFYSCRIAQPAAVFDGTRFHLFFVSHKLKDDGTGQIPSGMGYTTSEDGIHFGIPTQFDSSEPSGSITLGGPSSTIVNNTHYLIYAYYPTTTSPRIHSFQGIDPSLFGTSGTTILSPEGASATKTWSSGSIWDTQRGLTLGLSLNCRKKNGVQEFLASILGSNSTGTSSSNTNPSSVWGLFNSLLSQGLGQLGVATDLPIDVNPTQRNHGELVIHGNNYFLVNTETINGKTEVRIYTTYQAWPYSSDP